MPRTVLSLIVIGIFLTLQGCASSGSFLSGNATVVELSEANFTYVARDVKGSSMQGHLLGVSAPQGSTVSTFAMLQVNGDEQLYDAAITSLWNAYREKHGGTEGRKLALVNIRQDAKTLNTLVYTRAELFITADVIEFIE